jgi:hypothetical protein
MIQLIQEIEKKSLKIYLKLVAVNAGIALSVMAGGQAEAVNFAFTKIADTNTPIPGGIGNFTSPASGYPAAFNVFSGSVDGNNIAFQGFGSNSQSGIYTSSGGVLNVVADTNTSIPDGSGNFGFGSFGQSFGDTFSLDGDNIAFSGLDSNTGQQGIYTSSGGVLNVVADTNTPIPGGSGNFGFFFGPSLDGNNIAFFGSDSNFEQQGIYTSSEGILNVIADTNTPIPGSNNFNDFSSLSLDNGQVAFLGGEYDPNTFETLQRGIYISNNGMLNVVADFNTFLPNSNAKFCQFDPFFSLDDGNVVFGASGCDPVTGDYLVGGIYAYLDGKLVKVIDFDDSLDGIEVAGGVFAGQQALSGDSIAFWVRLTDGSNAIYVAQSVDEPNSALGLLALGILGGGLMLKHKQRHRNKEL